MQLAHFLQILAATSALVQADPLASAGSQALDLAAHNTLRNPEIHTNPRSLGSANPEDRTVKPRQSGGIITRYTQLAQGQSLLLSSGIRIVVSLISLGASSGVTVPSLGSVATSLDTMGITLGQHASSSTGVGVAGITLSVAYNSALHQVPAMTGLEWQTIIFSMYDVLTASHVICDSIEATFQLGQDTLQVVLTLSG
jgi:hypothetical protein